MHPEVHYRVRLVRVLKPLVVRGVLRVRGEVSLEKKPHGVALHAERGLDAYEHVADL